MALDPGDLILSGKYRIEELVGEGSFAQVYRVMHIELKATRAIKVLRADAPGIDDEKFQTYRERFRLEAQFGAQLNHPNVIKVFDFEEANNEMYLVMEYAAAGSLKDWLEKQHCLPVEETILLAQELCDGLAAIHEQGGAVHRDLKPSNILFGMDSRVMISDLGLVQLPDDLSDRDRLDSQAAAQPGTWDYMSPEQEREKGRLAPTSDIFSLGCVLFEVLTGERYKEHRGSRVRDYRHDAPIWLDEIIKRALADQPGYAPEDDADTGKRYRSALLMRAELVRGRFRWIPVAIFVRGLRILDSISDILRLRYRGRPMGPSKQVRTILTLLGGVKIVWTIRNRLSDVVWWVRRILHHPNQPVLLGIGFPIQAFLGLIFKLRNYTSDVIWKTIIAINKARKNPVRTFALISALSICIWLTQGIWERLSDRNPAQGASASSTCQARGILPEPLDTFITARLCPELTPTVSPTSVATISQTPIAVTPTPPPTTTRSAPTATKIPTVTPTRFYLEPLVLLPAPKTKFTLYDRIEFSWTPIGGLRELDYYRVQIARDSDFHIIACQIRAKESLVELQQTNCNNNWQFNNLYFFHVQVIALDEAGTVYVLSPEPGRVNEFAWQP